MPNLQKNAKIFIIVESPTKADHIAEYFHNLGYTNASVMASKGHIAKIKDNKKSYYNTGVHPDDNFKIDFVVDPTKKALIKELQKRSDDADVVILMTDADREGSAISSHLKHFLKIPEKKYYRLTVHEITQNAIEKALPNLGKIDENLSEAAFTRMALDRMFGFRISSLIRNAMGGVSGGRCQSPTLGIVVIREREIRAFVPEIYYEIWLHFFKNKKEFKAKYIGKDSKNEEPKLHSEEEVNKVISDCKGNDYLIKDIVEKELKQNPKPVFTTSTLQVDANKSLGFSPDTTMSLAQKLFESGRITYHRSDSDSMDPDFLKRLQEHITMTYGKEYCGTLVRDKKKKGKVQDGHEGIRITNLALTPDKFAFEESNELSVKLYRFIYLRTLQCTMTQAVIKDTQYIINNKDHLFSMHNKTVLFDGFRKVYESDDDKIADDDIIQETFKKDEKLKDTGLISEKKQTNPPSRYTEGALVKKVEDVGIGRPSTYATIVKANLDKKRRYCEKDDDKKVCPTELGEGVWGFLEKEFKEFTSIDFTKKVEEKLDDVENGERTRVDVLKEFHHDLEEACKKFKASGVSYKSTSEPTDKKCPKCGKPLLVRSGKFGKFLACSGYPECKYTEKILKTVGKNCPKCGAPLVERFSPKTKKKFLGCSKYPGCTYLENL